VHPRAVKAVQVVVKVADRIMVFFPLPSMPDPVARRSCLLALLLSLVLAGCATRPPAPETAHWESHQRQLLALRHWQIEGKLGYRSPGQNGSAFVNWRQAEDAFDLSLTGPFGAGATRISGDDQLAVLQQQGRDEVRAPTAAELTESLFGWPLPVAQMVEWVKGVPAPQPRQRLHNFNLTGQLDTLEQAGWQLRFDNYQQVGELVLPGRIRGNRDDVSFTLVVRQWQVGEIR
jgi:outer membrane lipoprotein LolB